MTTTVPTSAWLSAWARLVFWHTAARLRGDLSPGKGSTLSLGQPKEGPMGTGREQATSTGCAAPAGSCRVGTWSLAEVLPSPSLTPTPRNIPGTIYCFGSLTNAKSVCDGWAGSSSRVLSAAAPATVPRSSNKMQLPLGPGGWSGKEPFGARQGAFWGEPCISQAAPGQSSVSPVQGW